MTRQTVTLGKGKRLPTHYEMISEKAFTAQVIKLAQYLGWKAAHFRPAMTKAGNWVTAVQGDGVGFPDLVLVHRKMGVVIFAELKSEYGTVKPEQDDWLNCIAACVSGSGKPAPNVLVGVWRPSMIEDIEELLRIKP
jgi:hypothetical protein